MQSDVAVFGAGIFGCWAALCLQEAGVETLLVDAWGIGHPRATSGGETRIIRAGYGSQSLYTEWAWEALREWRRRDEEWHTSLFVPCGVLWLGRGKDAHMRASLAALAAHGIPVRKISPRRLSANFPGLSAQGVDQAYLEPECGVLRARSACRRLVRAFAKAGGRFEFGRVLQPLGQKGRLGAVRLAGGVKIEADCFLFCCGPWLPEVLPDILAERIRVSRQEVFFFGTPSDEQLNLRSDLPAWIDFTSEEIFYGVPAVEGRAMKVACDSSGPPFDPSREDRAITAGELCKVRTYLSKRLPKMKNAPLVEARVCQYERTPDSELILDWHPDWSNLLIAGGGSGHGFKLGPMVGRVAADLLLGSRKGPPRQTRLARFS
ncbi:MAG: NAD(P)/FAD-dependent oxidoreductase [Acidobacteriota bacterium]